MSGKPGWLPTLAWLMVTFFHFGESIEELLLKLPEVEYVLVTCLDSNWKPSSYLQRVSSPNAFWQFEETAILTGKEAKRLAKLSEVFVIFSEVWFFSEFPKALPPSPTWQFEQPYKPSAASTLLVDQFMTRYGAILAMSDGFETNMLVSERFVEEVQRALVRSGKETF